MKTETSTTAANAAALGGLDGIEPPAPATEPVPAPAPVAAATAPIAAPTPAAAPVVDMQAMIAAAVAAAIQDSPLVRELKEKLADAERKLALAEADKQATQLADRHAGMNVANEAHASTKERWAITLDEARDANEIDPVFVSVNGRAYYLKRGRRVEVPREVVETLNHAVQTVTTTQFDDRTGVAIGSTSRNARRFPYQLHGKAIDINGARLLSAEELPTPQLD